MSSKNQCELCGTQLEKERETSFLEKKPGLASSHKLSYDCENCGRFDVALDDSRYFQEKANEDPDALVKIRRIIALEKKQKQITLLHKNKIDTIIEQPLPSINQQIDYLIRIIGRRGKCLGVPVDFDTSLDKLELGIEKVEGLQLILEHVQNSGYVKIIGKRIGGDYELSLTIDGWKHYESLKRGGHTYNQAFMAMKFENHELDKVIADVFVPSCEKCGFTLIDLSKHLKAGLIDDRIRVEIQSSDFLIADLTHNSHGAYWEAGYAEGLGKPVIYTCKKDKFETSKTHFDTNHHLTIVWDPENLQEAGEKLKATIRATLPGVAKIRDE